MSPAAQSAEGEAGPMRIVVSAYPDRPAALAAIDAVLARRLAACANLLPIDSRYWWKGRVESARESLVLFKTVRRRVGTLVEFLERSHPYEVPEVAEVDVPRANHGYLAYLAATLASAQAPPLRRNGATRPEAPRGRAARRPGRTRAPPHRRSR